MTEVIPFAKHLKLAVNNKRAKAKKQQSATQKLRQLLNHYDDVCSKLCTIEKEMDKTKDTKLLTYMLWYLDELLYADNTSAIVEVILNYAAVLHDEIENKLAEFTKPKE